MLKRLCFSLLFLTPLGNAFSDETAVSRIAFGSCLQQNLPQPVWGAVRKLKPDLFIFMGDNVYADTYEPLVFQAAYDKLSANPAFQALRAAVPVIGTWDDHDYGLDDGGTEFRGKVAAQEAFFDFFDVPADSPRRGGEGIYHAELYGLPGRRVQVILLDTRTFRSSLKRDETRLFPPRPYLPNTDPAATLLGRKQWNWLREQLLVPADIRLIVSSIQVLPTEQIYEKWANFPFERKNLFTMVNELGVTGVIFLSGDRHFAEISREEAGTGYPLIEATSSSLNNSAIPQFSERNSRRVGPYYAGNNFGFISIDWDSVVPRVSLEIRDEEGHIRLQQDVLFADLGIIDEQ